MAGYICKIVTGKKGVYIYTSRAFVSEFTVAENLSKLLCAVLFDFDIFLMLPQVVNAWHNTWFYLLLSVIICM